MCNCMNKILPKLDLFTCFILHGRKNTWINQNWISYKKVRGHGHLHFFDPSVCNGPQKNPSLSVYN